MAISIGEMMSKNLQTVQEVVSVQEAAKKMKDRNVSSLVVIDADGKPQGLVTERDLVRKFCISDVPSSTVISKEVMSSPIITIKASSPTSIAADMMLKNNVRHLLIVDDGNKPIGIITPFDFTRHQGHTVDEDRKAIERVLENYMEWL